jgi:Protein of unknown function (DUF2530)
MKLTSERPERPPPPPPLEADDQFVIRVGTAGWAIALVVLLIVHGRLPPSERWWIWTCVAGLAFGLFAMWYVPRLKRGRTRAAAGREPAGADGTEAQSAGTEAQSAPRDSGSNTVSSTETPGRSTRS